MPAYVWEPPVLDRAAAMLRELHDATEGFDRAGRVWALPAREPAEVICHNDFAPYNLAFRDGLPVGAIDFEAASPGPLAWDLAYLAYRLVPLAHAANPDLPPQPDAAARLARLCAPPTAPSPRRTSWRSCPSACERSPPRPRRTTPSATSPTPPALNPELFGLRPNNCNSATQRARLSGSSSRSRMRREELGGVGAVEDPVVADERERHARADR